MRREGQRLRWLDANGKPLPDLLDLDDERRATANERDVAQAARILEAKARRAAEHRAAELEAELVRLRTLVEG